MSKLRTYGWEGLLVGLIIATVAWSATLSPYFLQIDQLLNASQYFVILGIVAFGLMPIIVQGEIDISLTSTIAVGTVTLGGLAAARLPVALALVITLALCATLGALNGILVAYFKLPSLAVTLGTLGAYRGLAYIIGGDAGYAGFPSDYTFIGSAFLGPVPVSLLVFIVIAIAVWALLTKTSFGRYCYAIGNSARASRMAGAPVTATKIGAYVLGAVLAGVAAFIWVGQYSSARGDNADGSILWVLTAVVLGGVSIKGGSGKVLGVVLSIVLLGILSNGMGLANFPGTTQTLVLGGLLIGSIGVPRAIRKIRLLRRSKAPAPAPADAEVD